MRLDLFLSYPYPYFAIDGPNELGFLTVTTEGNVKIMKTLLLVYFKLYIEKDVNGAFGFGTQINGKVFKVEEIDKVPRDIDYIPTYDVSAPSSHVPRGSMEMAIIAVDEEKWKSDPSYVCESDPEGFPGNEFIKTHGLHVFLAGRYEHMQRIDKPIAVYVKEEMDK